MNMKLTHIITLHKNELAKAFDIEKLELALCIFIEEQGSDLGIAVNGEGTTYQIDLFGNARNALLAMTCMYFVKGYLMNDEVKNVNL